MDRMVLQEALIRLKVAFHKKNDGTRENQVQQLLEKLATKKLTVAMSGHFSAGKSSMINEIVGRPILPSSPIPTSANIVTIGRGVDQASLTFRDHGKSDARVSLLELEQLHRFATDGEEISGISITAETPSLPPDVVLMDTPGIDSTDDAHKLATEASLHLADVVVYMTDYNHVQSELNFMFLQSLQERGKKILFIVNQIDKYRAWELSFSQYQDSVRQSLSAWNINPLAVYFTTLRDPSHPYNEMDRFRAALQSIFENKDEWIEHNLLQEASFLIDEHLLWLKQESGADDFEIDASIVEAAESLEVQIQSAEQAPHLLQKDYKNDIGTLVDNAIITPYQITEMARDYVLARRPGFRVGLLFSAVKTQKELERRLDTLYQAVKEQAASQLEWHLKELLIKKAEFTGLQNDAYRKRVYDWHVTWDERLIADTVKEGALSSDSYVYRFVQDLASTIKQVYRQEALQVATEAVQIVTQAAKERAREWNIQLDGYRPYLEKVQTGKRLEAEWDAYRLLLEGNLKPLSVHEPAFTDAPSREPSQLESGYTEEVPIQKNSQPQTASFVVDEPREEAKSTQVAQLVSQASHHLHGIPGMSEIIRSLEERASRLEHQSFTVALFGAFSAGKSSLANALLGERVLPVSPNPTTATVNKIVPPTAEFPHGTVRIHFKSAVDMAADIETSKNEIEKFGTDLAHLPSRVKPHLSFVETAEKSWEDMSTFLGTERIVGLDEFAQWVAEEQKACFVDWIELHYDCPFTARGISLVDTPGADSINARHTGVAFEYIKNADAILFVTYYNHAFSQADRSFLTQLGRVKDAFELDKMFFVINAADLAQSEEELADVVSHVRKNLISFGISSPRMYPVSSHRALESRLYGVGEFEASGFLDLESDFYRFVVDELTDTAIRASMVEVDRAKRLLEQMIQSAQSDSQHRMELHQKLIDQLKQALHFVNDRETASTWNAITQEVNELVYYVRQRTLQRFGDTFSQSFHPSELKDDGRDLRKAARTALDELIHHIVFELEQELRATALRTDRFLQKTTTRLHMHMIEQLSIFLPEFTASPSEYTLGDTPIFEKGLDHFQAVLDSSVLSHFKNTRQFFEQGGRQKMRDELERLIQAPIAAMLADNTTILLDAFKPRMQAVIDQTKKNLIHQLDEWEMSQSAALTLQVSTDELEQKRRHLIDAAMQISQCLF